jgi:hypothetical protein
VGFHQALLVQDYQSLCAVVTSALGGPSTAAEGQHVLPEAVKPVNAAQMQASFAAVFGNVG